MVTLSGWSQNWCLIVMGIIGSRGGIGKFSLWKKPVRSSLQLGPFSVGHSSKNFRGNSNRSLHPRIRRVREDSDLVPRNEEAAKALKKRTLTNLYNTRPQWLADAHASLDAAVAAAYGWNADISDDDALRELLELNLTRSE